MSSAALRELLEEYRRVTRDYLRWVENDKSAPHAVVVESRARGVLQQHETLEKLQGPQGGPAATPTKKGA